MKPLSQNPSNSTPLSEQELREKIGKIMSEAHQSKHWTCEEDTCHKEGSPINQVMQLILQDRKAWGEYVIGEKPYYDDEDLYADDKRVMHSLIDKQRQRNQGEKTDE